MMLPEERVRELRQGFTWNALELIEKAALRVGMPPMSDWWKDTLREFYIAKRRQLVLRVGRRGGKSSTLCRVAVLEALFGQHEIPEGDTGVVAFVSVLRQDADDRLRTIRSLLTALEEPFSPKYGSIVLTRWNREFRVYAASIGAVSGFSCIAAIADELAKWRDADTGVNPAKEVLASLRATSAGLPSAKHFLSSSPLGMLDAHAHAFGEGDTALQLARYAPTWVARPALTQTETEALEPRRDVWRREYAAIPLEGTEESLYAPGLLTRATRAEQILQPEQGVSYVAAMDPGMRANAWTFAIAGRRKCKDGVVRRSVVYNEQWIGTREHPNEPIPIMRRISEVCRLYGCPGVYTDQYSADALRAIGQLPGIDTGVSIVHDTQHSKVERYESIGVRLRSDEVELPPDPFVRNDMLNVSRKVTPNGFAIVLAKTPDDRHSDYAPCVALALERCDVEPEPPRPNRDAMETMALRRAAFDELVERGYLGGEDFDPNAGYGEIPGQWT